MRIIKLFSIGIILAHAPLLWADTRDNALALFDFAEASYPELLSPAAGHHRHPPVLDRTILL